VRLILQDLYDWHEPITLANWQRLDALIRERADDRTWWYSVLDRLNIRRTCTEIARRGDGQDDARLQYSIEWAFFTRRQWGEFDTALYELERAWGRTPEPPSPIGGGGRPATERTIHTLDDVHAAIAHYVGSLPYDQIISTATGISTDIDYQMVSDAEMTAALSRRAQAGPMERDIYASYINEAYLSALEKNGRRIIFQFSIGAEPLPFETANLLSQRTIGQIAEMIARHPTLHCPISVSPATGGTISFRTSSGRSSPNGSTCFPSTNKSGSFPTPIALNGLTEKPAWCESNCRGCWPKRSSRGNIPGTMPWQSREPSCLRRLRL
jgi:hypothetical protein